MNTVVGRVTEGRVVPDITSPLPLPVGEELDLVAAPATPPRSRRPRRPLGLRVPPLIWRWWETAGVCIAIVLVLAVMVLIEPTGVPAKDVARNSAVLTAIIALVSSVLLYIHWRLTTGGPLAWLVVGLSAMSVHWLAMAGLIASDPTRVDERPGLVLVTQLALNVGVLTVVILATRRLRFDPLATGVAVGTVLFLGRYVVLMSTPGLDLPVGQLHRLAVITLLLDLTIAVGVASFPRAPRWVCRRLGIAFAFFGLAHAAAYPVPQENPIGALVSTGCNLAAATVLLSLAIALVRLSIRENRAALSVLYDQVKRMEAGARADRAELHEIRATISGISTAAQVVGTGSSVSPVRQARVRQMMDLEIARLERLMQRSTDRPILEVDLDVTLDPLVVRHREQGRPIDWISTGCTAVGRADDIAEIVNILLENAFRHGRGSRVALLVRSSPPWTEIAVSDNGPGVPPALRSRIFEWRQSGPGSAGEGIGLHVARSLSADLRG
ncbi:MAG: HAMP domain-containing sensor histidine kinase, partial [Nocardioides sp.]